MRTPERRRVLHPRNSPFASPKAKVQQHLKSECDINEIVARARRGIAPSNLKPEESRRFMDFSNAPQDLTEAFMRVESAWEAFEQLPAKAREELGNDPRNLMKVDGAFLVRHGLAKRQATPGASPGDKKGVEDPLPSDPPKGKGKPQSKPKVDEDDAP